MKDIKDIYDKIIAKEIEVAENSKDFKEGDIITFRNGKKTILRKGFCSEPITQEGLLGILSEDYDIVSIDRPIGYENIYKLEE